MIRPTEEIVRDLRLIHFTKEKEIIPFVGAGSSILLAIPDWKNLVFQYHQSIGSQLDFEELSKKHNENWPKITQEIYDVENNRQQYLDFMSQIAPGSAEYHDLHIKLILGFKKIITTNFDKAFEACIDELNIRQQYTFLYFPNINPADFTGKSIAYLHGHLSNNTYVFRESEYSFAYTEHHTIKDFLRSVIQKNCVLFLGFSFNDITFREKLKEIILEERKSSDRIFELYGQQANSIQKLYVILHERDLEIELTERLLNSLNINFNEIESYFDLQADSSITIKSTFDIIHALDEMKVILNERYEPFMHLTDKLKNNRIKLTYFSELEIEIIKYSGDTIEVHKIIKDIIKPEIDTSEDLSSANKI